jgi:hypothetical protein
MMFYCGPLGANYLLSSMKVGAPTFNGVYLSPLKQGENK